MNMKSIQNLSLWLLAGAAAFVCTSEAFLPQPALLGVTPKRASSTSLNGLPKKLLSTLLEQQPLQQSPAHSKGVTTTVGSIAFPTLFWGSSPPQDAASTVIDASAGSTTIMTAASLGLPDPTLTQEAHLFAELSHVGLDLATFLFGGTGVIALRAAAVLGRVCAMLADYLPDGTVLPDELVFQTFMLSVSVLALVQAVLPAAFAVTTLSKISLHDGKAFAKLFAPAGTTWAQFKALLSVQALEWVTLSVDDNVINETSTSSSSNGNNENDDGDYVYWLFSGAVQVTESSVVSRSDSNNPEATTTKSYHVSASHLREDAGRGLLGERRLLQHLQQSTTASSSSSKNNASKKKASSSSSSSSATTSSTTKLTIQATAPNTKLLRIHTGSLRLLMNNDQHLADAIRSMLFASMEAKLHAAQQQQQAQPPQLAYNGTVA